MFLLLGFYYSMYNYSIKKCSNTHMCIISFRFVYGYDIAASLSFDDADNLLYAAEKYMIGTLKNQLAIRLMTLLDYDNICSLLNNPACFKHLELNCSITRVQHHLSVC